MFWKRSIQFFTVSFGKKDNINCKAWERVKRDVLCNQKENGGLNMINLHDFQNSFFIGWAGRLITEESEVWVEFARYMLNQLGGISVFKSNINPKDFIGLNNIKSKFWKDVVQAWIESNSSNDNTIRTTDPINNNNQLTVNDKPLFMERSLKRGIICIQDMLESNELITYNEYESKVGNHPSNLFEYLTMKSAIVKVKDNLKVTENEQKILFKDIACDELKRKNTYKMLVKNETCYCENMWKNKIGYKINEQSWVNIFQDISEIKLQEIQWKILHNIFPTNILLNRMGLKNTENCEFCNEKDFVEHYFFNCRKLVQFWKFINNFLNLKLDKKIILYDYVILLGIEQSIDKFGLTKEEMSFINNILVVAKLSIIKSKQNSLNIIFIFENEIKLRKSIDVKTTIKKLRRKNMPFVR